MGTFVALEGAEESFKDELLKAVDEAGHPFVVISLRTLRSITSEGRVRLLVSSLASGNPCSFVLSKVAKLFKRLSKGKLAVAILENFDVWAPILSVRDVEEIDAEADVTKQTNKAKRFHGSATQGQFDKLRNAIVQERDIEGKFAKTKRSWVYKLLYFLRYSVAYRLADDGHKLICLATYGNADNHKQFYSDIFHYSYDKKQFLKVHHLLNLGLKLSCSECENNRKPTLEQASVNLYLNALKLDGDDSKLVVNPLYKSHRVAVKHSPLELNIPFEVNCKQIVLSQVTLICGEQGSGKTTLLNAIIKLWLEGQQIKVTSKSITVEASDKTLNKELGPTKKLNIDEEALKADVNAEPAYLGNIDELKRHSVYKLELYNVLSQYVGSGESFIRHTFQKARNSKPSLVVIDDVEILFQEEDPFGDRGQSFSTLSRTLINGIHALEEGVIFIASTSGNVTPNILKNALSAVPYTTIFLKRNDSS